MRFARLFQRAFHLWERLLRESKSYPKNRKAFNRKIAKAVFWDGVIPPGKSPKYIQTIAEYVDSFLSDLLKAYQKQDDSLANTSATDTKIPIWCCWWQGEDHMPELVHLCHDRLKQVIPPEKAELHLITLENYRDYVEIPEHILKKFEAGTITMTTMSDVLRFCLLERYGGYWLDATVFFTGEIPEEYFSGRFYCQKMVSNVEQARREACGCNWCGFSMAGPKNSIVFRYMKDAFSLWWEKNDRIIDYVLIDYLLLSGYRHVPAITSIINQVPDNNEDIFAMYQVLNQPYSDELFHRLTARNVMHKLTYKMDLQKVTESGEMTLYGYLFRSVYGK